MESVQYNALCESVRHFAFQFALKNSFLLHEASMSNQTLCRTPEEILKSVFGYTKFRRHQREIIQNVLEGRDTLAVMPTGGGKSLCYQIPSMIFSGITVVISPLISLMQDQVSQLNSFGVNAACLNSAMDWNEYRKNCDDIQCGKIRLVYVSPEGLNSGRIKNLLHESNLDVKCITVDEAHCISEWGHDFRPDYLEIASIRSEFPDAVFLALTATATSQVRQDIVKNLRMENPAIFISSFNRSNIFLQVVRKSGATEQALSFIRGHKNQAGIVYCFSRRQVDELTQKLNECGIKALPYHAGLSDEKRAANQKKFIEDKVDVMVATLAFGMGINKPDVRYVLHFDLPKSVEQYYQEIGRAGRDGLPCEALLLYGKNDIHKIRYFFNESADSAKAEKLLQGMVDFAEETICRREKLLSYFGESYSLSRTDGVSAECCCDICAKKNSPAENKTVQQKKFKVQPFPKIRSAEFSFSDESEKILANNLRVWRRKAADELGVPPYVIFGDKTLFDLTKKKPASMQELLDCYGIGENKAEKFGWFILRIVKES